MWFYFQKGEVKRLMQNPMGVERHECYETFYELYEYVWTSLKAIVDHEAHPHVYSSLLFTWD